MEQQQAYQEFNNWCNEKDTDGNTRLYRCTKYLTEIEGNLLTQAMQLAFVAGYKRQFKDGATLYASLQ